MLGRIFTALIESLKFHYQRTSEILMQITQRLWPPSPIPAYSSSAAALHLSWLAGIGGVRDGVHNRGTLTPTSEGRAYEKTTD